MSKLYNTHGMDKTACEEPTVITRCYTIQESEILRAARGISIERHAELCQAEREVRAVVLPCKVGDILYGYLGCWIEPKVMEWKVACIHYSINKKGEIKATVRATVWHNHGFAVMTEDIPFSDFGKTVFLTREAALAKEAEE